MEFFRGGAFLRPISDSRGNPGVRGLTGCGLAALATWRNYARRPAKP